MTATAQLVKRQASGRKVADSQLITELAMCCCVLEKTTLFPIDYYFHTISSNLVWFNNGHWTGAELMIHMHERTEKYYPKI